MQSKKKAQGSRRNCIVNMLKIFHLFFFSMPFLDYKAGHLHSPLCIWSGSTGRSPSLVWCLAQDPKTLNGSLEPPIPDQI